MILALIVLEIYNSETVGCGIFDSFLITSITVSDVVSGMANQDVGLDVCANFGDSRLKLRMRHFRSFFERR